MKNKISLFALLTVTALTGCVVTIDNSSLDLVKKQKEQKDIEDELRRLQTENGNLQNQNNNLTTENDQLKAENEELKYKQQAIQALEDGNWQIINGNGVSVDPTNDLLGFKYKYDGKEIINGKTLEDKIVNKDITLTDNFEKLFEGLIDDSSGTETVKDAEVDKITGALTKFRDEGKKISELSADERNIIQKLDGCTAGGDIKYADVFGASGNEEKAKMYDLVLKYLKTKNLDNIKNVDTAEKKLKYKYTEKNKIKQGRKEGNDIKLKYADFGYWEQSFDTTGMDDSVKKYLKNELKDKTLFFANGAEHYKSDFNVSKVKTDLTFTGKTFAFATKGDKVKDLKGAATLSIKKGEATGKFDLDFTSSNWYKFSLDKLKLDGFTKSADASWTVTSGVSDDSIDTNFKLNNGNKTVSNDEIKGKFYGDSQKLEEVAGTYKFKVKDDSNEIQVDGAFGAKKDK